MQRRCIEACSYMVQKKMKIASLLNMCCNLFNQKYLSMKQKQVILIILVSYEYMKMSCHAITPSLCMKPHVLCKGIEPQHSFQDNIKVLTGMIG